MKILGTAIAFFIIILFLSLGGFMAYMTLTDYEPAEVEALPTENNSRGTLAINTSFSIVTFNIGYCGLDKEQDFFMDGGIQSRSSSKEQTLTNLKAVYDYLRQEKPDFILMQEVDVDSTRSFHINQYQSLTKELPEYNSVFGLNYKVAWVPIPFRKPMGQVNSGLLTFSRFNITGSNRYRYPGEENWPRRIFELDRCFIENRIPIENGRELVLINSHLSAFDEGGKIRKIQLEYLKGHITAEAGKGNYIIAGGDWNHVLPGSDPASFEASESWPFWLEYLPEDFTPEGFQWAGDETVPTVRNLADKYQEKINFTAVIDGFLVSDNIKILDVKGEQLFFENSDHNPVTGLFILE